MHNAVVSKLIAASRGSPCDSMASCFVSLLIWTANWLLVVCCHDAVTTYSLSFMFTNYLKVILWHFVGCQDVKNTTSIISEMKLFAGISGPAANLGKPGMR